MKGEVISFLVGFPLLIGLLALWFFGILALCKAVGAEHWSGAGLLAIFGSILLTGFSLLGVGYLSERRANKDGEETNDKP